MSTLKSVRKFQRGSIAIFALLIVAVFSVFGLGIYLGKNLGSDSRVFPINPSEDELLTKDSGADCNQNPQSEECVLGTTTTQTATDNSLPTSGYRRQKVQTDKGIFVVDIVAGDLNSTRVTVDTAAEGDCSNNCPVLSLKDYVVRNGAYAGVNGTYFCPATYASCAGKTNSFDTLLMNKNKKYFNSANNVYSTVPAAIFYGNTSRFVSQSLEWGRDTGVDAVIANYPLLVLNGQLIYGGSGDGKLTGKGGRSFIASKDNIVYIGVVKSATVADSAKVLHTLGVKNALNLDSGGSTALWFGGYKAGPGRSIPNAVLLKLK